ncbi:coa transferase, caib/baif family [Burkholderia pseudomallei 406e]|nr:coa transferase, caib/baif family [Burkholderia pseudomallei 406e]
MTKAGCGAPAYGRGRAAGSRRWRFGPRRTKVGGTRLDDRPPLPPPNDDKASARAETPSTFLRKPTKRA